jgi:hypothetical protein
MNVCIIFEFHKKVGASAYKTRFAQVKTKKEKPQVLSSPTENCLQGFSKVFVVSPNIDYTDAGNIRIAFSKIFSQIFSRAD